MKINFRAKSKGGFHETLRHCSKYNFNHIFIIICIIMENYFGAWQSEIVNVKSSRIVEKTFPQYCRKSEWEELLNWIAQFEVVVPLGCVL